MNSRKDRDEMTRTKRVIVVALLLLISTVILIGLMLPIDVIKWLISYTTLYAVVIGTSLMIKYYLTELFNDEKEPMW